MPGPSLFRHSDFLKLWGGQTVSQIGSQISMIAVPLTAVIALHATPFQVGLLGTFQFLPFLVVGLFAGVVVDRLPRRGILIAADCGRAVAMASIPLAAVLHGLTMIQLYVVGVVAGTLTVFFDVAYQSYLPALVTREQLIDGNAKLETTHATSEAIGPGIGGLLVTWLTAPMAVIVDAVSYVVSVVSILQIRRREAPVPHAAERSVLKELREGLFYVLHHRVLRLIAMCTGLFNLFAHITMAVLFLYAVREIGLTPAQIGLWFAVGSLGGPVGAVFAGRITKRLGIGRTLFATGLVGSAAWILIPAAPKSSALPFFMLSGLLGSLGIAYNIAQVSLRQAITPERLQGRMNATMRFLVWGPIPVGSFIGGVLGGSVGLHTTLWIAAIGGFTALIPISLAPVRRLRDIPPPVTEPEVEFEVPETP